MAHCPIPHNDLELYCILKTVQTGSSINFAMPTVRCTYDAEIKNVLVKNKLPNKQFVGYCIVTIILKIFRI